MVFVDEASKIKSPASLRHIGIQRLLSRRWVFITATPMINKGTCILGPMFIIWESIVAEVEKMANPEIGLASFVVFGETTTGLNEESEISTRLSASARFSWFVVRA
jgi:hypothetical protein